MIVKIKIPSWNTCYRIANNRIYKTQAAKDFQNIVGYSYNDRFFKGDVKVEIEFWRSPLIDVDNACKLVLDSIQGVAYENDRQIVELVVKRHKCGKGEDRLIVSVTESV